MKKFIILSTLAVFLASIGHAQSQIVVGKEGIFKDSIRIGGQWVSGITTDTSFWNDSNSKIATTKAVRDYVKKELAGFSTGISTFSITDGGDSLTITDGNGTHKVAIIDIAPIQAEVDGSVSNELQTISKVGQTVTLSNSGGSFTDSNGLFDGIDGEIPNGTNANAASGGTFSFDYFGGVNAILFDDGSGGTTLKSKDQASIVEILSAKTKILATNVEIQPRGSGAVKILPTTSLPSHLELSEDLDNGSNKVTISVASSIPADYSLEFPSRNGTIAIDADIDTAQLNIDSLVALSGIAKNKKDFGTGFSGSTIPDYSNIFQSLQALETAVELKQNAATALTTSTNFTGGDISGLWNNLQIGAGTVGATELANTTVTPGSYTYGSFTVDAQGRLTAASSGTTPNNFFNADLTASAARSHSMGGFALTLNNMPSLSIGNGSTGPTDLRFLEDSDNGSNYFSLIASSSMAANNQYTWPNAYPAANGYALTSSTSGALGWAAVPSIFASTTNAVAFFQSTTALQGTSAFTFTSGNSQATLTGGLRATYTVGGSLTEAIFAGASQTASNAVAYPLVIQTLRSSGSGANGIGTGITFQSEDSGGFLNPNATIRSVITDATPAEGNLVLATANGDAGFPNIIDMLTLNGEFQNIRFNTYTTGKTGTWNAYTFFESDGDIIRSTTLPLHLDETITAGGTTGNQTINKYAGSVNFAAAATSLTVTNSLVTTNSVIICTVATNDATMTSCNCVAGSGSFVINANAAATGETRVNFIVTD